MSSATLAGTSDYFERRSLTGPPATLGKTDLFCSPIGFGGYRIGETDPEHAQSLELALLSGCNLIDTSANYTAGQSERLIGKTLKRLITNGKIKREEIIVVTKAGYVQGPHLELARKREDAKRPFTDMVKVSEDCWHCISPDFLEDQITRSLERLELQTIDVLLLHNPEYFLKTSDDHTEYYARIRRAFEHLEQECARGRIRWYGISSNTFPAHKQDPEYTSLEAVLEIANDLVVEEDHFAVIQFPLNLFEAGAVFEENNSGKTVAALAREAGLGTLINRPLNSFHDLGGGRSLIRLTDFPAHDDEDIVGNLKNAWMQTMELEQSYPQISANPPVPASRVAWGHVIRQNFAKLTDIDLWRQTLRWQITPSLEPALAELEASGPYREWALSYRGSTLKLLIAFTAYVENQAAFRSDKIAAFLDHAVPPIQTSKTLSRKAVRLYRSIPGVDCVLVGIRKPEYVQEMLLLDTPLSEAVVRQAWLSLLENEASVLGMPNPTSH
jgi:aryl-alcohol dehydrogenase-like predicted oxidoreductase